ncbi:hypothetical protein H6A60_09435 [Sutterella massiliensis]|uniref:Uncharacterized protein n=1 Tax=Sutterella massiliensis TaxID=1816689 RepID=A0ABS2DTQ3_9BURK|nr:hypothetical protein [Sutterella massiliensis]MBM6704703.1 hypothetical protein [Sutterella massiliensis]
MFVLDEGSSHQRGNKTGVISCRLPFETKLAAERLAAERGLVLSHLLRDFIIETVRREDPDWWRDVGEVKKEESTLTVK